MQATTHSIIFHHLCEQRVAVQVTIQRGVPKLIISGMANRVVRESRDRIMAALKSQQIKLKSCRTVVNLLPTDMLKKDNHLELAIVAGILSSYKLFQPERGDCFIGSLGLNGDLESVSSILALVIAAKNQGFKRVFLPKKMLNRCKLVNDIKLVGIDNIKRLLSGSFRSSYSKAAHFSIPSQPDLHKTSELISNSRAIRVLQIAAAGHHHLLLTGPPGYGKSLMANCLQSLLPALTYKQILELTLARSLASQNKTQLVEACSTPPLQILNSQATATDLIGNNRLNKVALLALAQFGIIFADEVRLHKKDVLSWLTVLLEPELSDFIKHKQLFNKVAKNELPIVVAATNPCPCGYYGTNIRECQCQPYQRKMFVQKLSGSFLDRIDLFYDVHESVIDNLSSSNKCCERQASSGKPLKKYDADIDVNNEAECLNSKVVKEVEPYKNRENSDSVENLRLKILKARDKQSVRYQSLGLLYNSSLSGKQVQNMIIVSKDCQELLRKAQQNLMLSNRQIFNTIKVARTIADLDSFNRISKKQLVEALSYRNKK